MDFPTPPHISLQAQRQPPNTMLQRKPRANPIPLPQRRRSSFQGTQEPLSLRRSSLRPMPSAAPNVPSFTSFTTAGPLYNNNNNTSTNPTFDELYDVSSDDDSALVPLKCSNSVKQLLQRSKRLTREDLPALIIPSPTVIPSPRAWPTIEKLRSATSEAISGFRTPHFLISPSALARLTSDRQVPTQNSTPSLDGSNPSDEPASLSPPTPEMKSSSDHHHQWDMPVQLHPEAMHTLQTLSFDFGFEHAPVIEVPDTQAQEMSERGLNINLIMPIHKDRRSGLYSEPPSAISVPSPGGFLASLDPSSQNIWNLHASEPPSSTTAEQFYNAPWNQPPSGNVVERFVEVPADDDTDGPPTARQEVFRPASTEPSVTSVDEVFMTSGRYEYDEQYTDKLRTNASSNMNRTSMWLQAQDSYLSALTTTNPVNEDPEPVILNTPTESRIRQSIIIPSDDSPKKSVRFAEPQKTPITAVLIKSSDKNDPLFYHAFQHLIRHADPVDAFNLRHVRADAIQSQRLYLPSRHHAQLQGHYKLYAPACPQKDFSHLPSAPNEPAVQKQRDAVARADKERQALQQISLSVWNLEATKLINGGNLLPRAAQDILGLAVSRGRSTPRILDLGGQATADWGWAVALEYRHAKVYTAMPAVPNAQSTDWTPHRGPSNHRTLTVVNPWTLPFPSNSFDVVSARSLHTLLRVNKPAPMTSPPDVFAFPFAADFGLSVPPAASLPSTDEYAATLAEIRRVLAPDGILSFSLLDAEVTCLSSATGLPRRSSSLVSAGPTSLAQRSSIFASALRSHGYDPCAGRSMPQRLIDAGFPASQVRRSWIELPVGGMRRAGSPSFAGLSGDEKRARTVSGAMRDTGIEEVTGLMGAVAWEKWLLKTQIEMGVEEGMLLDGVGRAIEDVRKKGGDGLGWRVCVGCARKE